MLYLAEYMGFSILPFILTMALLLRGRLSEVRVLLTALPTCFICSILVAYGGAEMDNTGVFMDNEWIRLALKNGVISFLFVYIPARLLYASKMK